MKMRQFAPRNPAIGAMSQRCKCSLATVLSENMNWGLTKREGSYKIFSSKNNLACHHFIYK